MNNGITEKGKLAQWFCKHKDVGSFEQKTTFQSLRGDTVYRVCKDCGKVLSRHLYEFEGNGYK